MMSQVRKYSIVLVDDEPEIRQRIISKIPMDFCFEVVAQADNGYDALELIEKYQPDVVVTDIKMPFIDGIELARQLKVHYPRIKVAFITGYNEFDYAKTAISLDVVSYLSKPISQSEVIEFLGRLKQRLDDEYQSFFNQEQLQKVYQNNLPALIENQFNTLITKSNLSKLDLERFMTFHIDLSEGQFVCGIIQFDQLAKFEEVEQLRVFLINGLKTFYHDYGKVYYFNNSVGLIFIIQQDELKIADVQPFIYRLFESKQKYSPIFIRIGVSEVFFDFTKVATYFYQAREVLRLNQGFISDPILYYKDVTDAQIVNYIINKEDLDELAYAIRFKSDQEIRQVIQAFLSKHDSNDNYGLHKQYFIISLMALLLDFSQSFGFDLTKSTDNDLFNQLLAMHDLKDVMNYCEQLVLQIRQNTLIKHQSKAQELMDAILTYIQQHYANQQLSMEVLCEKFEISPSYCSTLFRKHTDSSFNKYLIKIRMEKAMELLMYTQDKIFEIAQEVGYNDVYYFSHSFKKFTGVTPKDYRNDKKD